MLGNRSLDPSPQQSTWKKKLTPQRSGSSGSESEDGSWEQTRPLVAEETDEEVTLSPNMHKIFTRLHDRRILTPGGGASRTSGPVGKSQSR